MSEIWSIPLVRISAAVGFAVVFLTLLTPLWDRHFQTEGRRRVWCMLVIALLIAPWLRLPIPVAAESVPLQEMEEGTTAVPSTSERVPESPLWMPEPAPAENENPSMSETSGTLSSPHFDQTCSSRAVFDGCDPLSHLSNHRTPALFPKGPALGSSSIGFRSDGTVLRAHCFVLPSSPAVDFAGSVFPHAGGTVASGSVAASGNRILPVGPVGAASRADPLEAS